MSREIWHRFLFVLATLLAAGLVMGEGWTDAAVKELTLDAGAASRVHLRVPAGEIRVEGVKGDEIHAQVRMRCRKDGDRCSRAAEKLEWSSSEGDKSIAVALGPGILDFGDSDVEVEIQVPEKLDLEFNIDAGEIHIVGMRACVNGHVDAGDVRVTMSADRVASVHLDTDVGDASLRMPGVRIMGDRSWLVGAVVNWDGGKGDCDVDISLNAGDLRLELI